MKRLAWLFYLTFIFFCIQAISCAQNIQTKSDSKNEFTIVSYNTQEFFDGVRDGCEYEEFRNKANWGTEQYKIRLERLCQVIRYLNADVMVFQEIENEAVLQDISNELSGDSWKNNKLWTYSCFSKEAGAAIGNGVLSRFPLTEMNIHALDIRSEKTSQPMMRPIMHVKIQINNREVDLYVNHWKSKSGGEEKTETWRNWQESVLAKLILDNSSKEENNYSALFCGDFNRDIKDFEIIKNDSEGNVILRNQNEKVKIKSPWLDSHGKIIPGTGSYYYNGDWERIDHIFYTGHLFLDDFGPRIDGPWCDDLGRPEGFKIYSGNGFSDHLPVMAHVYLE